MVVGRKGLSSNVNLNDTGPPGMMRKKDKESYGTYALCQQVSENLCSQVNLKSACNAIVIIILFKLKIIFMWLCCLTSRTFRLSVSYHKRIYHFTRFFS